MSNNAVCGFDAFQQGEEFCCGKVQTGGTSGKNVLHVVEKISSYHGHQNDGTDGYFA